MSTASKEGAQRVRQQTMTIGFFARWRVHSRPFLWISFCISLLVVTLLVYFRFDFVPSSELWTIIETTVSKGQLNPERAAQLYDAVLLLFMTFASAFALTFVFAYGSFLFFVLYFNRDFIASHVVEGSVRGRYINWVGRLSGSTQRKMLQLSADEREPFILCRSGCHAFAAYVSAMWDGHQLLEKLQTERRIASSWGRFNQLNYLITMSIADGLGLDWKQMRGEGHLFSDQVTCRDEQKSVVREFNECDLPLRFIQAEPQRRFVRAGGAQLPKPKYVMFHCLFNSVADPIWVLPLKDVMAKLKEHCSASGSGTDYETVVRFLSNAAFSVYARIRDEPGPDVLKLQFGESRQVPILHTNASGKTLSGYDENSILYDQLPPPAATALFLFQRALDDAAKNAICVQLRSGDVLLVKNQEALFARREVADHFLSWPPTLAVRARWLRSYYLYSKLPEDEVRRQHSLTVKTLSAGRELLRFMRGHQVNHRGQHSVQEVDGVYEKSIAVRETEKLS